MSDETSSAPAASDAAPAPSPAPAPDVSSPSPSQPPAETSADAGQSKESLLDAVLKVVPATTETDVLLRPKDDAAPPDAAQPASEDQAETETDDSDDDEAPSVGESPDTRRKVNKLLKQRRELRDELSRISGPAQIGSELETFARTNDLSGEDVAATLRMAAMLRAGDYRSFYQAIAPFVRTAQEYLGIVLPRDLQSRVQQGHMTEDAAKEFARQRYDQQRAEFERSAAEATQGRQAVQYVQDDVRRAVSSFELRLSASDPDYKAKAPAVRRAAQAMLFERGGAIGSVEEALEITRAAYDEVNRQVRSYQPKPQATRPSANGTGQTPSARSSPNTLMEAALQGLENARRTGG